MPRKDNDAATAVGCLVLIAWALSALVSLALLGVCAWGFVEFIEWLTHK